MAVETQDRWTEIRGIHKQYRTLYEVLGGFTGIALLVFIGFTIFAQDQPGFAANVYTETISAIASIIVTVLILDRRAEQREEKRRVADLQARLVREAGSPDNATALNAVRELRARSWLVGDIGILKWANLSDAKLAGADLEEANLAGVDFWRANLEAAHLEGANLTKVEFEQANLEGAYLEGANLTMARLGNANLVGAHLEEANLVGVRLREANLTGADLSYANLTGADLCKVSLKGATFLRTRLAKNTVLPDGKLTGSDENLNLIYTPDSYYQPGVTDMGKYTDPDHPDFWQPEWVREQQAGDDDAGKVRAGES